MLLNIYAWIVAIISIFFLLFALTNAFWLWIYSKKPKYFDGAKVSVCIPARNEEKNIEKCIRSLLNQSYKNYNLYVLDDNSTDKTGEILARLAEEFPGKINILHGKPLEQGWTGKIFAMSQIVAQAAGELMLFTDADTVHNPDSIAFAVSNLIVHNADMVSGYIGQRTKTFGEKITVPLMYMLSCFVLPTFLNRVTPFPFTSVAIGQYIMIKKSTFDAIGGYSSMKNLISEDVALARLVKSRGYKTIFIDCKNAAACRMYTGYKESSNGIMKNIFSFMNNNDILLLFALIAFGLFLTLPFPLFVTRFIYEVSHGLPLASATILLGINVIAMFLVWTLVAIFQRTSPLIPFLYPVLFFNILYIACLSYIKTKNGSGYVWKGRVVH